MRDSPGIGQTDTINQDHAEVRHAMALPTALFQAMARFDSFCDHGGLYESLDQGEG